MMTHPPTTLHDTAGNTLQPPKGTTNYYKQNFHPLRTSEERRIKNRRTQHDESGNVELFMRFPARREFVARGTSKKGTIRKICWRVTKK
ncbi:hypothetical protein CEXT_777801 [Caerostris extrusa]|uniref:Uncharacterized protein n=1 Tax=Caerostris extrusa TaxID=172846 RepID=A0AAV4WZ11_CAEEX|nr:hypothetical protein CEXT_777801 [Caerostris extrusa]